jgi:tetratricopeptide (TPR) repeat protein
LIDASRDLAEAVTRNSPPPFMREVVLCQLASLTHVEEFDRAQSLIDAASRTWRDDPDLLLARGSLYETAFERGSRAPLGNRVGMGEYESITLERLAQKAVAHLERVLAAPVPPPEARLRLGRMLTLRQKYRDALPMLERARTDSDHTYLRYLASLFLGQLHERVAHYTEAEEAYRAAYGEIPAQSVTLSLARLLIVRGEHTSSDALLLRMFEARRSSTEVPDPWRLYEFGQFWRLEQRLSHLRTVIR